METVDFLGESLRLWKVGSSRFLAWPERGARLLNWNITMADGTVRDIIHWPERDGFDGYASIRGGNPILFPFCARTYCDGELGYWRDPKGVRRPMPRHGFARDGKFTVESIDDSGFTARLQPTAADHEAYPFDYEFEVVYRFRELAISVELRLRNLGKESIPWCAGHHFYFQLPWHEGATREDYRITIPAKKAFYHAGDGRLAPTGKFPQEESFATPELVDRIHTNLKDNRIAFGPKSGEEDIIIKAGLSPAPAANTAVVTWTEAYDSPFYCVEPWMGPPNSPEHKKGLGAVAPGRTEAFSVEVSLF